jgi:nucleoside-diphosphate-sugar epimerase
MRALVTGSSGFIGRHIARALDAAGYSVMAADIREGFDVRYSMGDLICMPAYYDVVVHCAAVVGGRRVMDWTPVKHAANLAIDAALFQWAQTARPARLIYFSSSCAYPAALGQPGRVLREDDISWPPGPGMMPDKLYGWVKLTGELLALTAAEAGVPVSIVRPFSVYGPGMNDGFAVRGFLEQVRCHADPLEIWGDDQQARDYIHVRDVAQAVLAIITQGVDGPVNLGTGRATSLRALARMMLAAGGQVAEIKVDPGMPAGVPSLVADTRRLHGFHVPQTSLEAGIRGLMAS